jgi:Ni/Co efflux regulator RcnB
MKINGTTVETTGRAPWESSGRPERQLKLKQDPEEIGLCLACTLPECTPWSEMCPVKTEQAKDRQRRQKKRQAEKSRQSQTPGPKKAPRRNKRGPLPIPDDFVERVLAGETVTALAKRYGVSQPTISNWRAKSGLKAWAKGRPAPEDFRSNTETPWCTNKWLAKHYQVGESVICRWKRELGIPPKTGG